MPLRRYRSQFSTMAGCRPSIISVALFLFAATGQVSPLILGSTVECPTKVDNCTTTAFDNVMERLGCLGCQGGCQPGLIMTANPKYNRVTDDPTGTYLYQGVTVLNSHDVYQPEWLCVAGKTCQPGYFLSNMGEMTACAWCGEGCSRCDSFNNCVTCYAGYRLNPHTLPGGRLVTTCISSGVLCPRQPSNCQYSVFLTSGAGCLGCQSCEPDFMVTFNPRYYQTTNDIKGYYEYLGVRIGNSYNVNEPRYLCIHGHRCPTGWYERMAGTVRVCEWCGDGCQACKTRGSCDTCKSGYTLQADKSCKEDSSTE